jgi:hypothetical protein
MGHRQVEQAALFYEFHLQDRNRRHSRPWRLIGRATPMAALLSAAVGPNTTIAGGSAGLS